jgi:hypothetical protein
VLELFDKFDAAKNTLVPSDDHMEVDPHAVSSRQKAARFNFKFSLIGDSLAN